MRFCFETANFTQRRLPFVVVGAVAWTAAFLVFATTIKAQISSGVVQFVAVPMIDAFIGTQGTPEVFGHNPTMLENGPAGTSHSIEHSQIHIANGVLGEVDVAVMGWSPTAGVSGTTKLAALRNANPAFSADTRESLFRHPRAKCAERIPPNTAACRADNFGARPKVPIDPKEPRWILNSNRWM